MSVKFCFNIQLVNHSILQAELEAGLVDLKYEMLSIKRCHEKTTVAQLLGSAEMTQSEMKSILQHGKCISKK